MSITHAMGENRPLYSNNVRDILNAWTPENQNTMIAALRLPSDPFFGENEKDSTCCIKEISCVFVTLHFLILLVPRPSIG